MLIRSADDPPRAMSKVQFKSGLSLSALLRRYGIQARCEQALKHARWPDGFVRRWFQATAATQLIRCGHRYRQCVACRRQTSVR